MHFIYLHLGVLWQRFNFDNKSKNFANLHFIVFSKSFPPAAIWWREYFTLERRVKALQTTIENIANETVLLIMSSLCRQSYVIIWFVGITSPYLDLRNHIRFTTI